MLESLGNKHVLVLRNHGIAVGESSIEKALFLLCTVQRAAENQCAAGALGGEDVEIDVSISQKCADLTAELIRESGFANEFFAAMVRKLKSQRPLPF
ncbi:hypothetical protein HORIV_70240 [Vreelandella olivaria]|uniref:Class II aldolase/adducin N-terminal domain-containing protein n=1 Tax=Vreelandella olivaria TaxID=390919 RepID=A0ABM7GUP8_9GAMM|nr:hypothetical protein HORIV_70240 [Halomonas olivaria]